MSGKSEGKWLKKTEKIMLTRILYLSHYVLKGLGQRVESRVCIVKDDSRKLN